jgi:hypothetical protein
MCMNENAYIPITHMNTYQTLLVKEKDIAGPLADESQQAYTHTYIHTWLHTYMSTHAQTKEETIAWPLAVDSGILNSFNVTYI